ncbi:MAG: class F sortase [bacterium]|nr:class F sortase [bacterium]
MIAGRHTHSRREPRVPVRIAAAVGVVLALALSACGQSQAPKSAPRSSAPSPSSSAAPSASASAPASPGSVQTPARLSIPQAKVQAPVEQVGVDAQGNMGVPSAPTNVAWYDRGPAPGQPGDAILNGHVDWTTGPAVFANLRALQPGDEITVATQSGQQVRFKVTGSKAYDANTRPPADLFATSGPPRISLITCTGPWDVGRKQYQQRLVVSAQAA